MWLLCRAGTECLMAVSWDSTGRTVGGTDFGPLEPVRTLGGTAP